MRPPEFTPLLRHVVCEEYGFPRSTEFMPLWVSQNRTYKVITSENSRPKILRLYQDSWRTTDALKDELRVLFYIGNKSELLIPKPIRNRKGELLTIAVDQTNTVKFAVFSFISGKHADRVSHSRMYKLGSTLAQLDQLLEEADRLIEPHPSKSRIIWDHEALIEWPLKSLVNVINSPSTYGIDHLGQEWLSIEKIAMQLKEMFCRNYALLPKQLLHGDAIFPNVKFSRRGVGILDFDEMGYGARIYELTPPLCSPQILSASVSYASDLVTGYTTHTSLTELEIRSLPLFVAARLFGSLGWAADHVDIPWAKDLFQTASQRLRHIVALIKSYESNDKVLGIAPSIYGLEPYGWSYYSA